MAEIDNAPVGEALPKKQDEGFPALGGEEPKVKGKKEKKKANKVSLNDFLADPAAAAPGGSWADAMDDAPSGGGSDKFGAGNFGGGYGGGDMDLPTGPASRFEERPQAEVPEQGPWKVYVGNLPYETREEDLANLFEEGGCTVADVNLVMDRELNRPKGFGYVEFEDRDSCLKALEANGHEVCGRQLRIDVATTAAGKGGGKGGGFGDRGGKGESKYGASGPDWGSARSAPRDSYQAYEGGKGGGGGGFGDRRGGGDRFGDRGGGSGDRDAGKGGDRYGSGGGFGSDRGGRYGGGSGFDSMPARGGGGGGMGSMERPKLALQKRSVSDAPASAPKSGASPFGDAAPVAVRDIEVKKPEALSSSDQAPKKKSNPFGDAGPVQIREIEIKDRPVREERAPREERGDSGPKGGKGGDRREGGRDQGRASKVGVWGRSAKEERDKERESSPKQTSDPAPIKSAPPADKTPAAWRAPAEREEPKKKGKKKGPVNAFEALNMGEDEDEEDN